jgi:hypothetical protein
MLYIYNTFSRLLKNSKKNYVNVSKLHTAPFSLTENSEMTLESKHLINLSEREKKSSEDTFRFTENNFVSPVYSINVH